MLLDSHCYQYPIACLIILLVVAESDQVVGHVLAGVLHCIVHSPRWQA